MLWAREMNNLRLSAMMKRFSRFLEALIKDASILINKMKQRLNTRNMRLVKQAIRIAKRKDTSVPFWSPEQGGVICLGYVYILEAIVI